jgi:hypothetical protein
MRVSCILVLGGVVAVAGLTAVHAEGNMKKLSAANLARSREFIMREARPLEQALLRLRLGGGSAEAVRKALEHFQNADGGFGKALEPDLRAPESSVLATVRALQILTALKTPPDHPMIRRTMAYLSSTFDETKAVWRIIPTTAGAYPHAPWWNQEQLEHTFGEFRILPRAEVLGYLFVFDPPSFPRDRRLSLLKDVVETLEAAPASGSFVDSCVRLYETGKVPAEYSNRLYQTLVQKVPGAVEQNAEKWKQYCLKPIWLVQTPESPFYRVIADSVERNLDYEIDNQLADGSWSPHWSWYGAHPDVWPTAEREWRGILTVQTLEALQAFGRIEP